MNTAIAWINQNKQISIPVITVGSIIILLILARCSWWLRAYTRRRRRRSKEKDSRPPSIVSNPPENGDQQPPGYAGFRSSQLSRLEVGNRRSTIETVPIETPLPTYGANRSIGASEEWEMQPTVGHHSRSSSIAPVPSLHNQDEDSSQSSRSANFRSSNPGSLMTTPVSRRMHAVSIASADSDTYLPPKHEVVNISDHPQQDTVV